MTAAAPGKRSIPKLLRLTAQKGPRRLSRPVRSTYQFSISGVTRDNLGVPKAGCIVKLFDTSTDTKIAETTSDGVGAFTTNPPTNSGTYWIAAFDPSGSPAGVTVNTLVAT